VLDVATEEPLAGVVVGLVEAEAETISRQTVTDSNGVFRFDGLDLRGYLLGFARDGYWSDIRETRAPMEDVEVLLYRPNRREP
jgi:hypothetical protein